MERSFRHPSSLGEGCGLASIMETVDAFVGHFAIGPLSEPLAAVSALIIHALIEESLIRQMTAPVGLVQCRER